MKYGFKMLFINLFKIAEGKEKCTRKNAFKALILNKMNKNNK